jgi:hypothetical protein
MKLRVWIWTIGLAVVGYSLAGRSGESPQRQAIGAVLGAVMGFVVGWGLQRLLDMGRRR